MPENGATEKRFEAFQPGLIPDRAGDHPGGEEGGEAPFPPAPIESRWLDRQDEPEHPGENAPRVSVREYIGFPHFRPLAEIPPGEIATALNHALGVLGEHHIAVDFIFETEAAEAYRFITEELLEEHIANVRFPDLMLHFTYEEFHPNEPEDARHWAEEFLHSLFTRNEERMRSALGVVGPPPGLRADTRLKETVVDFYAQYPRISRYALDPIRAEVEGDLAEVAIETHWQGRPPGAAQSGTFRTLWTIGLRRSPYSGWDVIAAERLPAR